MSTILLQHLAQWHHNLELSRNVAVKRRCFFPLNHMVITKYMLPGWLYTVRVRGCICSAVPHFVFRRRPMSELPVLFTDGNRIHVHTVLEPPLFLRNLDVVAAHLPLPHQAVVCERPVLQAVATPPLSLLILRLIPELNSDL